MTEPGDTRPLSFVLMKKLQNKYGPTSAEVKLAWKFFKAGYDGAVDDFMEATEPTSKNENWYNEEPTLKKMRKQLGLRLSKSRYCQTS